MCRLIVEGVVYIIIVRVGFRGISRFGGRDCSFRDEDFEFRRD